MAKLSGLNKEISFKSSKKAKMPTKKTINLAAFEEKQKTKLSVSVPVVILVVLVLAAVLKFGVYDLYASLNAKEAELSAAQNKVEDLNNQIDRYTNINEEYAHYTFSDFTDAEKNLADRIGVIQLIDKYVTDKASISSWTLYQNTLVMTLVNTTLGNTNKIVARLETDEMVNFCTVTTATTSIYDTDIVTAKINIYLNGPQDIQANAEEETTEGGDN